MIQKFSSRPQSSHIQSKRLILAPISSSQQVQKCFLLAKHHHSKSNYDEAIRLYLQCTLYNPKYYQAYCNMGACFRQQYKFIKALQAYQKARNICQLDHITNYNLANLYRIIGDYDKAIQLYLFTIKLKEQNHIDIAKIYQDSYNNLAICYKNLGHFQQAIQAFHKLKIINNNQDIDNKFNLAGCYLAMTKSIIRKNQSFSKILLQQYISKTKQLFQQLNKTKQSNSKSINEFIQLSLIQIEYLNNQNEQTYNKSITKLNQLINEAKSSQYTKEQASKQKAYVLGLLSRYKQSAQQYKKSMQKKVLRPPTRQQIVNKYDISHLSRQQKPQLVKQPEPSIQNVSQPQNLNKSFSKTKTKQVPSLSSQFYQQIESLIVLVQSSEYTKCSKLISQCNLPQNLKNQLQLIVYSMIGEKEESIDMANKVYNIYNDYFLQHQSNPLITKDMFSIETHRAVASTLTMLGYSQLAIKHYQVVEQNYHNNHLNQGTQLQQLHQGLASNYESQGLHEKAIHQFKKALQLQPDNYVLIFNLGYCQQSGGEKVNAIQSFTKFLTLIQSQQQISVNQKQNLKVQGLINIFLCTQSSSQNLLTQYFGILSYLNQCQVKLKDIINQEYLIVFYLKTADLLEVEIQKHIQYQQTILQRQDRQVQLKQMKQKLFDAYMALLQMKNCPDRCQILMNCGNILYQQRQYLNALQFYLRLQKLEQQSNPYFINNLSLTYLHLNKHPIAFQYLNKCLQLSPSNPIYLVNYQIFKWIYPTKQLKKRNNKLMEFQCQCQGEIEVRLEFGKCLLGRFTQIISQQKQKDTQTPTQRLVQQYISKILINQSTSQHNQQHDHLDNHKYHHLRNYFVKHCQTDHKNHLISQINQQEIYDLLKIVTVQNQNINGVLSQLNNLIGEIKKIASTRINYLSVISSMLQILIISNKSIIKPCLGQLLQKLSSQLPIVLPPIQIPLSTPYPSKEFLLNYPSIQLKLPNMMQTFLSWQRQLEDQIVYYVKVVEEIVYKKQFIRKLIKVQHKYGWNTCGKCQQCFQKTISMTTNMFGWSTNHHDNLITNTTIQDVKKQVYEEVQANYHLRLMNNLTTNKQQDKILNLKLSQNVLPYQLNITFISIQSCHQFIAQLYICMNQQPTPIHNKPSQSKQTIILGKLLKINCKWSSTDQDIFVKYLSSLVYSPFGLINQVLFNLNRNLQFLWGHQLGNNNLQILNTFLNSINYNHSIQQ